MHQRGMIGLLLFCIFVVGCSSSHSSGYRNPSVPDSQKSQNQPMEESAFKEQLDEYMVLSPKVRQDLRTRAETELDTYQTMSFENKQKTDARQRFWYYSGVHLDNSTLGVGLANSLVGLKTATGLDPSYAEAWAVMGTLLLASGDPFTGIDCLDKARVAMLVRNENDDPVDEDIKLLVYRDRAWALRDLTRWDEGLLAVKEGLTFKKGDSELVLIKGLLLAGAGRYSEATSLAVRMPPVKFPKIDYWHYGQAETHSDYANRWIKSQALLAIGDYETARQVLGDLISYENRLNVPYMDRFWADVGLVSELVGEKLAGRYYAQGFIARRYGGYFPWGGGNLNPVVLDVPNPGMPVYTSFGGRFMVGGSILTYVADQMNKMSLAVFDAQREDAAGRALRALDIAQRRNIRPAVCQAMRGRIHYSYDRKKSAHTELTAARLAFLKNDQVDAGTSMLLGMLAMDEGKDNEAISLLNEAVGAEDELASGWRMLGVLQARAGDQGKAEVAMNKALRLEPHSVAGLYNRGLLRLQQKRFVESVSDLEKAWKMDPENHEVQRVLQMAATSYRANGGDPGELRLQVEEYKVASSSDGPPVDLIANPAALVAQLNAEITAFFVVPDSISATLTSEDETLLNLAAEYQASGDSNLRRNLTLAYMDRKMYAEVQKVLAPGWGIDLEPGEEVILLYVDRILGETERAKVLADALLAGETVTDNRYLMSLLKDTLRLPWWNQPMGAGHHLESYGANSFGIADVFKIDYWMGVGFERHRAAQRQGYAVSIKNRWFLDVDGKRTGSKGESAVNDGRAVSRAKSGDRYK